MLRLEDRMPSPFPGMDPYIEVPELWSDFHADLAGEIRSRLNRLIQPAYAARLTPYATYEEIEIGQIRGVRPDVGLWRGAGPGALRSGAAVITPAPFESRMPLEVPLTLHRVEIRTTAHQQLVTVIDVLSPVNKRRGHEAFEEYRRKRRDLLRSSVHLIEIDLLRQGERPELEEPPPRAPYYVFLHRAEQRRKWPSGPSRSQILCRSRRSRGPDRLPSTPAAPAHPGRSRLDRSASAAASR